MSTDDVDGLNEQMVGVQIRMWFDSFSVFTLMVLNEHCLDHIYN